ncbi:MAG: hypothetical protein ACI8Y8_003299 [Planctomycetota bacterium]|jgi:hypothetical protein
MAPRMSGCRWGRCGRASRGSGSRPWNRRVAWCKPLFRRELSFGRIFAPFGAVDGVIRRHGSILRSPVRLLRIAGEYPAGPVSGGMALVTERLLGLPEGLGLAHLLNPELGVEDLHQASCRGVIDLPEGRD